MIWLIIVKALVALLLIPTWWVIVYITAHAFTWGRIGATRSFASRVDQQLLKESR